MIITAGRLSFDYILASPRMKADVRHFLGVPVGATCKWKPEVVAQKLVDAGLCKINSQKKDGSIASLWCDSLTVEQVEAACLSEADCQRLDRWMKKGVK